MCRPVNPPHALGASDVIFYTPPDSKPSDAFALCHDACSQLLRRCDWSMQCGMPTLLTCLACATRFITPTKRRESTFVLEMMGQHNNHFIEPALNLDCEYVGLAPTEDACTHLHGAAAWQQLRTHGSVLRFHANGQDARFD